MGCDYCEGDQLLLYYNDVEENGKGCELILGASKEGWYLEVNTRSKRDVPLLMTGDLYFEGEADNIELTPLNFCPVCGVKL